MTKLAFLDTETTGLDPSLHRVYEVGLILEGGRKTETDEFCWWLELTPHELEQADLKSLEIGRYHERKPEPERWHYQFEVAERLAVLLDGAHLVGAVPSFDDAFLKALLDRHGYRPSWHYHLVDVEALAAGAHGIAPPWNSNDLSRIAGVEPDEHGRHTALGDARWAKAIYDAVLRGAA